MAVAVALSTFSSVQLIVGSRVPIAASLTGESLISRGTETLLHRQGLSQTGRLLGADLHGRGVEPEQKRQIM